MLNARTSWCSTPNSPSSLDWGRRSRKVPPPPFLFSLYSSPSPLCALRLFFVFSAPFFISSLPFSFLRSPSLRVRGAQAGVGGEESSPRTTIHPVRPADGANPTPSWRRILARNTGKPPQNRPRPENRASWRRILATNTGSPSQNGPRPENRAPWRRILATSPGNPPRNEPGSNNRASRRRILAANYEAPSQAGR